MNKWRKETEKDLQMNKENASNGKGIKELEKERKECESKIDKIGRIRKGQKEENQ